MSDSLEKFKNFCVIFDCKCLDCCTKNQIYFLLGGYFNIEGDLINKEKCKYKCDGCDLEIIIDFNKIFSSKQIRQIHVGIKLL